MTRPANVLWLLAAGLLALVLSVPSLRHGLPGWQPVTRRMADLRTMVTARAERVDTADAWAAAAEFEPEASDRQWRCFDRALAQAPRDEAALVRRAVHFSYDSRAHRARALAAIGALLAAYPDNAVGYYLQASCVPPSNMADWLRRGNDAARFADDLPITWERCASAAAVPTAELELRLDNVDNWNGILLGQRLEHADAATTYELARFAGRLRDQAGSLGVARLGCSLQRHLFVRVDHGQLGPDGWASKQAERTATFLARLEPLKSPSRLAGPAGRQFAWSVWAHLLRGATLLVLLSLLPGCRHRQPAASWAELGWLCLRGLLPALAFAALVVPLICAEEVGGGPARGAAVRHAAMVVALFLPLALTRLAWHVRGGRTWQGPGSALAATLLVLLLAATGPQAWYARLAHQQAGLAWQAAALRHARA